MRGQENSMKRTSHYSLELFSRLTGQNELSVPSPSCMPGQHPELCYRMIRIFITSQISQYSAAGPKSICCPIQQGGAEINSLMLYCLLTLFPNSEIFTSIKLGGHCYSFVIQRKQIHLFYCFYYAVLVWIVSYTSIAACYIYFTICQYLI